MGGVPYTLTKVGGGAYYTFQYSNTTTAMVIAIAKLHTDTDALCDTIVTLQIHIPQQSVNQHQVEGELPPKVTLVTQLLQILTDAMTRRQASIHC